MEQPPDDIITAIEAAEWLKLSPRFLRARWLELGGVIIDGEYRISKSELWGGLKTYADTIKKEREKMVASKVVCPRTPGGNKIIPLGAKGRAVLERGKGLGRRAESGSLGGEKSKLGLRDFRPMAATVFGTRLANHDPEDGQRKGSGA